MQGNIGRTTTQVGTPNESAVRIESEAGSSGSRLEPSQSAETASGAT